MKKRTLGHSNIEVAPLMFGGNVFGWTLDEVQSFEILDAFIAAGFDFIDTADVYSRFIPGNQGGESETVLGKWMKARGNRSKIILSTKVGMDMGEGQKGLSKACIFKAVEASLRRLQTDYIDLYQAHIDDENTPLIETLDAFDHLIKQGKVRVIGASNYTPDRLEEALKVSKDHGLPAYQSLQPLYNLYDRAAYEAGLQVVCQKHGLGVIPYFALASGFLTGKYRSAADFENSARGAFTKHYLDARGLRILAALDAVAKDKQTTPAAIALAWLMARPTITAPIASATSLTQLQGLIRATEISLDPAAIELLNQASAS
ncbi:MAG: aldo/keto reductase [Rugosibacter sp.]|nr:MAG: aldo/keto reductase [Rugosibacter sp.]